MKIAKAIGRHVLAIAATVLLGTLLTAAMMRLAPGFDTDEHQLDSRLSHETQEAARQQRGRNSDILRFYFGYVRNAAHGDFGDSLTLNRPVRELVQERFPATVRVAGPGLLAGWALALTFAFSAMLFRQAAYDALTATIAGALLCVPSAAMALGFVILRAPAHLAVALIVFPNVFRYTRNLLARSYAMPHVTTARAKGIGPVRVLFSHVLPVSAAPLIALVGVSVSIALGAAVPVEALCGIPGIGQLAWQAALGRDLPLLVTLTMLVTVLTLAANTISDAINSALAPVHA